MQWAAFFSNAVHEVLPVTAGDRVTLSYELFAYKGSLSYKAGPAPYPLTTSEVVLVVTHDAVLIAI